MPAVRFATYRIPKRRFGVELETNGGEVRNMSNHAGFSYHHDGTIRGLEFVSPPLKGRVGLRRLRAFMADGHGIQLGRNCGFHAHFETRVGNNRAGERRDGFLTDQQLFAVTAAYIATQDRWFTLVSPSRRRSNWCHSWNSNRISDFVDGAMSNRQFVQMCSIDRYHWLNISAYMRHGTFENRLHQATWNFGKVRNWIRLNLRFIKAASRIQMGRERRLSTFQERAGLCLDYALSPPGSGSRLPSELRAAV